MKKLLLIALLSYSVANAQIVTIPDANFKSVLLADTTINTNRDTEIQLSEASAYAGWLGIDKKSITDLTGIEAFVKIRALSCAGNALSTLNLSANPALTYINCENNQLTLLTLSTNDTGLATLACSYNQLQQLNLSPYTKLTYLDCSFNKLKQLDLSSNTDLNSLYCLNNKLSSLNLSVHPTLKMIACGYNQLTSLNVSNNPLITDLSCDSNLIGSLDVSANPLLLSLRCDKNQLTSLNISANTKLWWLDCDSNQLTALDVSTLNNLYFLNCNKNQITSLNVSSNGNLRNLLCDHNQLTYLNVKNGSNSKFQMFMATSNPPLACIQVDNATYSSANWTQKDPAAQYSTNCATGMEESGEENDLVGIYPNPSNGDITFSGPYETTIRDITGKSVLSSPIAEKVDIKSIPAGLYFITLSDKDGTVVTTQKLVKQ